MNRIREAFNQWLDRKARNRVLANSWWKVTYEWDGSPKTHTFHLNDAVHALGDAQDLRDQAPTATNVKLWRYTLGDDWPKEVTIP